MLRLASNAGQLVPGRCRSTRQCEYCARLAAVQWAELLSLDAMHGVAPTVYVVLTTREVKPSLARLNLAKRKLLAAIRGVWPGAEYCCITEFTTGRGTRAGGKRRPHLNLLLKGVPSGAADLERLRGIVADEWTTRLDARPEAQHVGTVHDAGGLMRYLALHFLKEDQRPPVWWRGHRVTKSRGYLWTATWKGHREARAALLLKRELYRAEQAGYEAAEAWHIAEAAVLRAAGVRWECVELTVDERTGEVVRGRPIHGGDTVSAPARRPAKGHGSLAEWEAVEREIGGRFLSPAPEPARPRQLPLVNVRRIV